MTCTTIDYHTAGEPFRIVADPPVEIPGDTVAERRAQAIGGSEVDDLRRLLCFEPRGHAAMYGGFFTPPDDEGADFGVLFWHKDGFSTACGHGTIALGAWAIESGRVAPDPSGVTEVVIDVPSGRVRAAVRTDEDGLVESVDFVNVPSRLVATGVAVDTRRGRVEVDLAWGGALYACADADRLGLVVEPGALGDLIAVGREVKAALSGHPLTVHPTDERLSGVYGTIFVDRLGLTDEGELHQRNVTIFADGQVDRSPCGSGTAARVAALWASGELAADQVLVHDSIVDTRFRARVQSVVGGAAGGLSTVDERTGAGSGGPGAGHWDSVVPVVTGTAHKVAECTFSVDARDDLVPGFVLR